MTQPVLQTAQTQPQSSGRPRRWTKCVVSLLVLCAIGVAFHSLLLQGLARLLVVDSGVSQADAIALPGVIDGESGFDFAARAYNKGKVEAVLLLDGRHERLVELGILPDFPSLADAKLSDRGVTPDACTTLRYDSDSKWEMMRRLGIWLDDHLEKDVLMVVPRFSSRQLGVIADSVLTAEQRQRVHLQPLLQRRFDETNWWRTRQGVLGFCNAAVSLVHTWFCGEPAEPLEEWNPDEYAASLNGSQNE